MSLLAPHNHWNYFPADSTVTATTGTGTAVTSGIAHTAGTWTQIHAGFTYPVEAFLLNINTGFTAATIRNSYVDIGVGATSGAVMRICEKLCGSHASTNPGRLYWIPVRIPPDTPVWARHQATTATASIKVSLSGFGGNMNPGSFPSFGGMVALGATTASTTGTAITPGASGAAGAWTQIVASTTTEYGGLMIGGLFTADTTMATTLMSTTMSVAVGASGQEKNVGPNITQQLVLSANEQITSFSVPSLIGIPAGQRISASASGSGAADTTNSIIIYGFEH